MKKVLPRFLKHSQGFTLVELLVVVAILAILMMVGAAVFSGTQKSARDAKRRADIEAISKAMEAKYGSTPGRYAVLADEMFASGRVPLDPMTGQATACSGAPCDYCSRSAVPAATATTACAATDAKVAVGVPGAGPSYVVCANLEAGGFFCLKSQQQD